MYVMPKQSLFDRPGTSRVNVVITEPVKAIIRKKQLADPNFNFSEFVRSLILKHHYDNNLY